MTQENSFLSKIVFLGIDGMQTVVEKKEKIFPSQPINICIFYSLQAVLSCYIFLRIIKNYKPIFDSGF
jgi:hypothetical protein